MKKITTLIISLAIIVSLGTAASAEGFTTNDALTILRAATGSITLTAEQQAKYDINGDGQITTADALAALRSAVGASGATTAPAITGGFELYSTPQPAALANASESAHFRIMSSDYIIVRNNNDASRNLYDSHSYDEIYSFNENGEAIYVVAKRIFDNNGGNGGYDSPEKQAEHWYNAVKDSSKAYLDGNILYTVEASNYTKKDLLDRIAFINKNRKERGSDLGDVTYIASKP